MIQTMWALFRSRSIKLQPLLLGPWPLLSRAETHRGSREKQEGVICATCEIYTKLGDLCRQSRDGDSSTMGLGISTILAHAVIPCHPSSFCGMLPWASHCWGKTPRRWLVSALEAQGLKLLFFLATSMQKTSISSIFSPWKSRPCLQVATSSGGKHRHFHISFCSSGSYAIHLHYLSWRNQAVYLKKSISCLKFENLCTALVFSLPCLLYNLDFIEMTFQNIDFTQMANKLVFLEENEIYIYIS